MCVEKPVRQAASTESSTAAPRRKRAVTERLHVFTPATPVAAAPAPAPRKEPGATARTQPALVGEPKRPQVASPVAADSRKELEKARTLPIAEARQAALGLAKTQPLAPLPETAAQPRRVRPAAPLPDKTVAARPVAEPVKLAPIKPIAEARTPIAAARKPIAEAPKPIAETPRPVAETPRPVAAPIERPASVQVSAPAVRAGIMPTAAIDDGWSQGRKRSRAAEPRPLRSLKLAEGTQPGVTKPTMAVPKAAGKSAVKSAPARAERPRMAEGSLPPPPTAGKPLPSLFNVIDRKKPEPQAASEPSRLPGLPPPPSPRPSIGGPKKAVSTVVAAASLGGAHMAIAGTRQTGQHAVVPPPAAMMLDDEDLEELEEIEPDLPDFVPSGSAVAGILMNARSAAAPTPLFDAPPRAFSVPPAATSFSAAERAFFAAGEEMDTLDMDTDQDTFDDLPGIERPSFWSRLKNRAQVGR